MTSDFAEEVTYATNPPIVLPQGTQQEAPPDDLYDAPTLDQPEELPSRATQSPVTNSPAPAVSQPSGSRFITVSEDARLERERNRSNNLIVALQLFGLLATLSLLVWIGWQLMQPASADELHAQIISVYQAQGDDGLRTVSDEIQEFFDRFPDDERIGELEPLKDKLEFGKFERSASRKLRGRPKQATNPIARKYYEAMAIAETDPSQAIVMLQSILALYDPENTTRNLQADNQSADHESNNQRWLILTRNKLSDLQQEIAKLTAIQLPAMRERIETAKKLQASNPQAAQKMYEAIIDLYGHQPWAKETVEQARQALNAAKKVE